jgi:hypothetical protein
VPCAQQPQIPAESCGVTQISVTRGERFGTGVVFCESSVDPNLSVWPDDAEVTESPHPHGLHIVDLPPWLFAEFRSCDQYETDCRAEPIGKMDTRHRVLQIQAGLNAEVGVHSFEFLYYPQAGQCLTTIVRGTIEVTILPRADEVVISSSHQGRGRILDDQAVELCSSAEGACTTVLQSGTPFTLVPYPATDWKFDSWSSGCCASVDAMSRCTVDTTADQMCEAVFTPVGGAVQLNVVGDGSVTVERVGVQGSENVPEGQRELAIGAIGSDFKFTAVDGAHGVFAGWSGDCGNTTGATTTLVASDGATCTATFDAPAMLNVQVVNPSGLAVSVKVAEMNPVCFDQCEYGVTPGTELQLSALSSDGSAFNVEWGAGCGQANGHEATVSVNTDLTCVVTFSPTTTDPCALTQPPTAAVGILVGSTPAQTNAQGEYLVQRSSSVTFNGSPSVVGAGRSVAGYEWTQLPGGSPVPGTLYSWSSPAGIDSVTDFQLNVTDSCGESNQLAFRVRTTR